MEEWAQRPTPARPDLTRRLVAEGLGTCAGRWRAAEKREVAPYCGAQVAGAVLSSGALAPALLCRRRPGPDLGPALLGTDGADLWIYLIGPYGAPSRGRPVRVHASSGRTAMIDGTPMALFVCLHNAGRSQMAAAFFERAAAGAAVARSAGTTPGERVHPVVVTAMREVGIDLAGARPQALTPELQRHADVAVTMGCGDACPLVPGRRIDWGLPDPKDQPLERVREIRDDIARRAAALAAEMGAGAGDAQQARRPV